jgi:hypothetical protein
MEVGLFGLIIEAEKDDAFNRNFQNLVRRHQSSLLDLRRPDFYKNHVFRVTLLFIQFLSD